MGYVCNFLLEIVVFGFLLFELLVFYMLNLKI